MLIEWLTHEFVGLFKKSLPIMFCVWLPVTKCYLVATDAIFYGHTAMLPAASLRHEDRGSMALRNDSILPHHYTVSQPRR